MPRFVGRPVVVEAHQFTGNALPVTFAGAVARRSQAGMEIKTADGPRLCRFTDWIMRGPSGEFSVMKNAAFETFFAPFEPAPDPPPEPEPTIAIVAVKRHYQRRTDHA